MAKISPYELLLWFLGGFAISLVYGALGVLLVWGFDGWSMTQAFVEAYTTSFKTLVSFGLIIGTTLVLRRTQTVVQDAIESSFGETALKEVGYYKYRNKFWSRRKTLFFGSKLTIIGFGIFASCTFPLQGTGEVLMMIAACAQYTLGAFVGRKLMYTGMMLHSLREVRVTRNIFTRRTLDDVNAYVILMSTLTIIFVYFHVTSYFNGPFLYEGIFGSSIRLFLLLPAVIATPVLLIFNFYPREIVRNIYDQSIKVEIKNLRKALRNEALNDYEKRYYIINFEKMSREELRYRLQLTISDLPFGITILIMVLQPLLK